jgi:hypothetical protein
MMAAPPKKKKAYITTMVVCYTSPGYEIFIIFLARKKE